MNPLPDSPEAIHAYAVWRSWSDQYELAQMEEGLRGEVTTKGVSSSPLFAVLLVGLGALAIGALFALAVAQ